MVLLHVKKHCWSVFTLWELSYWVYRIFKEIFDWLFRFRKNCFQFWEFQIYKNNNFFAFLKTYRPPYYKWLARYVFVFLILSFSMQIWNSQWIKFIRILSYFFPDFPLRELSSQDKVMITKTAYWWAGLGKEKTAGYTALQVLGWWAGTVIK